MIIVLILWSGIFGFLLNLDRRIKILEKEITGEQNED
jgi:CcmD family protein